MPRDYKRKLGSRRYQNYTSEMLQNAVDGVKNGQMSLRKAAEMYGINRQTIKNKLVGKHSKTVGRQRLLCHKEEKAIIQHVIAMSDFGFPMDTYDLRVTVKMFLDRSGRRDCRLINNFPGYEWCLSFLKRNKELSVRLANNIKKKRAAVSRETLTEYINNLEGELKDIPPENIFNFDETNLTDDPGNRKIICKRGVKYPERIMNTSKTSISLMYCGNAAGDLLPPYVVYKAEHLWSTWTEGGPDGTRYNRSKSGWFDTLSFEDWFFRTLLPVLKKKTGKCAIIGDNLSSHINIAVLEACKENDIKFICLPPNATHLCQPLDVAFFGPMKKRWRKLLTDWKRKEKGSSTIPKDVFPKQLKKLHESLHEKKKDNLINGFRKTGIFPLSKDAIIDRLPQKRDDSDLIGNAFLESLSNLRQETAKEPRKKKQKLSVPAGKSIDETEAIQVLTNSSSGIASTSTFGKRGLCSKTKGNRKRVPCIRHKGKDISQMKYPSTSENSSDEEIENILVADAKRGDFSDYEPDPDTPSDTGDFSDSMASDPEVSNNSTKNDEDPIPCTSRSGIETNINLSETNTSMEQTAVETDLKLEIDKWVVVNYEGSMFPGKIKVIKDKTVEVSVMQKSKKRGWRWPEKKDQVEYELSEVVDEINEKNISTINNRGVLEIKSDLLSSWDV